MDVYSKAREYGIELEFIDGQGHRHVVSGERLRAVIDGLPPPSRHPFLKQPVVVVADADSRLVPVRAEADGLGWRLVESNQILARGCVAGETIDLPPAIPIGTYRLEIEREHGHKIDSIPLLVTPAGAYQGWSFDRAWVLSVQLYGLASSRNWGIGDFTDLATLIELTAGWGCAGIGLNPLHALFVDRPLECSPYAPNSRLFLNPLYVDPERLPHFPGSWLTRHREQFDRARSGDLIDYAAVAELKLAALRHAFEIFQTIDRGNTAHAADLVAFESFKQERGVSLRRFACFEVLRRQFDLLPWWQWPEEWRRPDDARIQAFRNGPQRTEIEFVEFVQWCAAAQLQSCADLAAKRGMAVGLYLDVAVGVQAGGFDAWSEQVAISRALSVGAPPDQLNTAGQDWGLAGFNAAGLEANGFAPFREMLRASMRYAGAIRLDHVLGLNRLYLIPSGTSPRDGVYVEMPLEALLAVIAQESVDQRCITIGEDLGTVPDGFRDILATWGVWSYKVMMFERSHDGAFFGSSRYAVNALVTFNTHDLASFAGWQSHSDLKLKRGLGLDPGETDEMRTHARRALEWKLGEEYIVSKSFFGAIEFLARTPSRILAIALDDLIGLKDQPNIPGTLNEHPNWRRRLPVELKDIGHWIDLDALRHALRDRCDMTRPP
ncbi:MULTISPECIES: 4-alpha-glucanotransferase [unclassified Nitrobacter]|uniref:4-alpha-glucanotransferase n=1 Tax=unclassified Nitrobacter TaxID=2620411 RepID=UPI00092A72AE|nr:MULTISPECIES: 4-alpha-glucanotransferase [unclassified Nitrobacter]MBN9149243.1 4-alpha-glucanotransferase [Nitrobacter sp.]OJU99370.1 MAG: 4-alpha-glucanotransferase [Nitrobacter sp. 62-23]